MDDKYSKFLERAIKIIRPEFTELIAQLRFLLDVAQHMKLEHLEVLTSPHHVCLKGYWLGEPISLIRVRDTEATVEIEWYDGMEEEYKDERLFFTPDQPVELDHWMENQ